MPQVVLGRLAGRLHVAVGQRRHAAADLARRHVDLDAVVVQHGDHRLGDRRVVVVGEDIHEVGDARPGGARPPRPAAPPGRAEEAPRRRRPAAAAGATRRTAFPAASGRCGWPAGRWPTGRRRCRARAKISVRARTQSARSRPCSGRVGRLGLEHQLGDVDVGRAFDRAHLAVDAQVGDGPHFVRRQPCGVGVRPQEAAHQVGLGPRRGRLVVRGPEDRAHAVGKAPRCGSVRSRCSSPPRARPLPAASEVEGWRVEGGGWRGKTGPGTSLLPPPSTLHPPPAGTATPATPARGRRSCRG